MITIISAILGLFGSAFPTILEYFKDKEDKKHEITLMQMQMDAAKTGQTQRLAELQTQENISEIENLYNTYNKSGIAWVTALNESVRPIIAYILIILYCIITYMYFNIISSHSEFLTIEAIDLIWTDEDQALFTCIIAFYFGSRNLKRAN